MKIHTATLASAARRIGLVLLCSLALNLAVSPPIALAQLAPGDIIVGEYTNPPLSDPTAVAQTGLMVIDPTTGNRTIFSDATHGTGPVIADPTGISFASDGSLIVSDEQNDILYRVDPTTGNRSIISSNTVGTGPTCGFIAGRQLGASILVTAPNLLSVDPATGNRTTISDPSVGSGPSPLNLAAFAISGNGNTVFASTTTSILGIDLGTGNRTVLSSSTVGAGPAFTDVSSQGISDIELDKTGSLLVSFIFSSTVMRVDPTNGNRTIISSSTVGTGPSSVGLVNQLGIGPDGTIYMGGSILSNRVVSIDPVTGNRAIVTDPTHGTGPLYSGLSSACAVVPAPEPSTIVLAALGGLVLLACRRGGRLVNEKPLGSSKVATT